MSAMFPRVAAACETATATIALERTAKTRIARIEADRADDEAKTAAIAAYGEEMLPRLFGGAWRLSRRNARFPHGVLDRTRRRLLHHSIGQTLFDHPLVYRQTGTRGPDSRTNCVIIGQPYPIVRDGLLSDDARTDATYLALLGWGVWWRADLSAHYPGWTQLVVAKGGLQACGTAEGFTPIASPSLGVGAWDEWLALRTGTPA